VVCKKTGEMVSLVTLQDLIYHFLESFPEEELVKVNHYDLLLRKEQLKDLKVTDLKGGLHEAIIEVPEDTNLSSVARIMLSRRTHRVVVFDSANLPVTIVTQKTIVKLLAEELNSLEKAGKTIKELGLGLKDVFCVSTTVTAYKAFKTMIQNKVSCVGVVDPSGVLRGSLSLSDI